MLTMYNTRVDFHESVKVAVLPIGAIEQHGSHLPMGTDCIIAEELARRVAQRLSAYLLPVIGISSSIEHREAKGTVYLRADTLALVIRDIACSLHDSGFNRLILINGHGGNWILKPTIRQLNRDLEGLITILVHSSVSNPRNHEVLEQPANDIHAGEKETSLIMHLSKEHVRECIVSEERTFYPQEYMDYLDNMALTEDGYWGYPELATKEKGEKLVELLEECAMAYITNIEETIGKLGGRQ